MNEEIQSYERIERYLEKKLSPQETAAFEQEIIEDNSLARQLDWMTSFRKAMRDSQAFAVLDEFEKIHAQQLRRRRRKKVAIALLAMVLLLAATPFIFDKFTVEQATTTATAESEEQPVWYSLLRLPPPGQQSLSSAEELKDEVLAAYDRGDYPEALLKFETYLATTASGQEDLRLIMLAGQLYLAQGENYQRADELFSGIFNRPDVLPVLQFRSGYYLAITRYAAGNKAAAATLLNELFESTENASWREEVTTAKALLFLEE